MLPIREIFLLLRLDLKTIPKLKILYVSLTAGLIISTHSLKAEKNLIPVVLLLDWAPNAQFAGIYQAVEDGFYANIRRYSITRIAGLLPAAI